MNFVSVLQANGTFLRVWWAQDGTPAHRRIVVMERLQQLFLDRIISLGRDHEWPPKSPDLTPLEFFVWGYLKSKVCLTQPANLASKDPNGSCSNSTGYDHPSHARYEKKS